MAINHSSDFDFKDFIKIYKVCTNESYSFLVNDTTVASDDSEKIFSIYNKIMIIHDQIRDKKKLQYYINKEAAKISA